MNAICRFAGALIVVVGPLTTGCRSEAASHEIAQASTRTEVSAPRPAIRIGHVEGAANAPVEVVEFSDFGCYSCAEFAVGTLPALRNEFIETGLVRWRFVPIRQGFLHGGSAAQAAECAAAQGEFWAMHDALAGGIKEWQLRIDPLPVLTRYAAMIGLDQEEFGACYREEGSQSALRTNDLVALQLGIQGTPTFVMPDRRVMGALRIEQFRELLRESLRRAARPGDPP